ARGEDNSHRRESERFRALMRICQAPLEVVSSGDVHLDGQHSEERPNGNDVRSRLLEAACADSSASVITTSIDLAQRSNARTSASTRTLIRWRSDAPIGS